MPPNFPARFHPSDIIEFGSDRKVINSLLHHAFLPSVIDQLQHFSEYCVGLYVRVVLKES